MAVRKCELFKHPKFLMINEHPCVLETRRLAEDICEVPRGIAFLVAGKDIFTDEDQHARVLAREATEPVVLIDTYSYAHGVFQHANGHTRSDLKVTDPEHRQKLEIFGSAAQVQVLRWGAKERIWNIVRDKTQPVEQSPAALADAELSLHARRIINNKRCAKVKEEISSDPRNKFYRRFRYGGCPVFCEAVLESVYADLNKHDNPIVAEPKLRRKLFRFARAWYYRALIQEPF